MNEGVAVKSKLQLDSGRFFTPSLDGKTRTISTWVIQGTCTKNVAESKGAIVSMIMAAPGPS